MNFVNKTVLISVYDKTGIAQFSTFLLKSEFINNMNVSMASDAFFPFRDNIDKCSQYGVKYILQPGGSIRDNDIINACDDYGILMCISGVRVFTH